MVSIIRAIIISILLNLMLFFIVFFYQPTQAGSLTNHLANSEVWGVMNENDEDTLSILSNKKEEQMNVDIMDMKQYKESAVAKVTISLSGDWTIGQDEDFSYRNSFIDEVRKKGHDYQHFVEHVNRIFSKDDLSLANLETTLTTAQERAMKKYKFKGNPAYVEILKLADIEAVSIANNHIFDYLETGYKDTMRTLKEAGIGFFGYENYYITTINGIRIGILGYEGWEFSEELKERIRTDLNYMKQFSDYTIVSFHWGIERRYAPIKYQIDLAHFTIDEGADLIFGHHPHVMQGIEKYKNRFIVYSLGNFMFGGNKNPSDKQTFVFQETMYFNQKKELQKTEINIIPFSISSVNNRNDYKPTPLSGRDRIKVLEKLEYLSSTLP